MPRKGHQKRDVLADPMYNSKVVTKLINSVMLDDQGVLQKIVYGALARVEEKAGKPAIEVFEEAMNNASSIRSKSKTYRWCNISGTYRS